MASSGWAAQWSPVRQMVTCSATCSATTRCCRWKAASPAVEKLLYRLYLYVLGQWKPEERHDKREVYSLVGANMSFARGALARDGL